MYFSIKNENVFDKHNETQAKVSIITKKNDIEPIYNKKYVKAGKKSQQKKAFIIFVNK